MRALGAGAVDRGGHLCGNFGRVGCTGAEDDLNAAVQVLDGVDEMNDALLAGDAPDKQDERHLGVDLKCLQQRGVRRRTILLQIDAVVNHTNPVACHSVFFVHV